MTAHKQTTDGVGYTTGYTYYLNGALDEQTYPSGRVVKNTLDTADGSLSPVQSKRSSETYRNFANGFVYNAAGAVTAMKLGNGRWENTTFNSRLQPTQIGLGAGAYSQSLLKLEYSYGTTANNGNVVEQKIIVPGVTHPFVQAYTYDELNRLKSATETQNSTQTWKQTFTFDRFGNRNFDEANTTFAGFDKLCSGNTVLCSDLKKRLNPSINASNNRLSTSDDYAFDASGNTTSDPDDRTFIYDAENKQVEVKDSLNATVGQYFYDGDGRRVKKVVPGGETTIFVYDAGSKLIGEYSTVVQTGSNAKTVYTTNDHLGSPRINTDGTGQVISRHDYHPFGEEIARTGYGSDSIRKQFTGYERDAETELDFAQARMYGSNHGRFLTPDPYKIVAEVQREKSEEDARRMLNQYIAQPQQWNLYAYAINSPLKFIDPTGETITLTGSAEQQQVALERIRNMLGKERFGLVTQSTVNGNIVLSITPENIQIMQKIGDDPDNKDFSLGMAEILGSSETVEFQVTEEFVNKHGKRFSTNSTLIPGGITVGKEESSSPSQSVQIFVNPRAGEVATEFDKIQPRKRSNDGNPLVSTNEMVDAHEFGEAHPRIQRAQGNAMGARPTSREPSWKVFENSVRSRDPNNPQRRARH